jgi:CheY-like chemotaxis protein
LHPPVASPSDGTDIAWWEVVRNPRLEEEISLRDVRVLIVEDDSSNAKLISIVLRAEGCDVHVARSAEDALAVIAMFRPRVIVMDLVLPLMSGVLLAQRLKDDTDTSDVAIVAVTAFSGGDVERIALAVGCAAYVQKPIDAFAFPDVIRRSLRPLSATC